VEDLFQRINPLRYITGPDYASLWRSMFATVLQGFWGRLLAGSFLFLSFWFGVRRRNFAMATLFFGLALLVTFGAPLLIFLGLL
jgi:hypothetical protein